MSNNVEADPPTAQGLNDILLTLGQASLPLGLPSDDLSSWTTPELHAEIRRLRTEVWRLNPAFFTAGVSLPVAVEGEVEDGEGDGGGDEHGTAAVVRAIRNLQNNPALAGPSEVPDSTSELVKDTKDGGKATRQSRKRKRMTLDKDVETGKRLEKGRKPELSKLLRTRMRAAMSVAETDPLPDPLEAEDGAVIVPDWASPHSEKALNWVDGIATEVYNEALDGSLPVVPPEDVDFEVIKSTARTAFHNFARKYVVENDPQKAEKRDRQAKGRRRWARKDLKRRIKASQDPSFAGGEVPPGALQLDYMSSEYSSLAEDSDDAGAAESSLGKAGVSQGRKSVWEAKVLAMVHVDPEVMSKGWAEGLGTKVLEVRTPRWRSEQLNTLYARLDGIANTRTSQRLNPTLMDSASGVRPGHVAPSHHRFSMPAHLHHRGSKRRVADAGSGGGDEAWMWKTGVAGVWPSLPAKDSSAADVDGVITGDIWEGYPPLE